MPSRLIRFPRGQTGGGEDEDALVIEPDLPDHNYEQEFDLERCRRPFEIVQTSTTPTTTATTALTAQDWLDLAKKYKDEGNRLFRTGEESDSSASYKKALHCLRRTPRSDKETHDVRVVLYVNLSACDLARQDYAACRKHATKAINLAQPQQQQHVKALFRRSVARRYGGFDLPGAESDLEAAIEASSSSSGSNKELDMLKRNLAELRRDRQRSAEAEKQAAKKMFQ